jgi:hypothetical protein
VERFVCEEISFAGKSEIAEISVSALVEQPAVARVPT